MCVAPCLPPTIAFQTIPSASTPHCPRPVFFVRACVPQGFPLWPPPRTLHGTPVGTPHCTLTITTAQPCFHVSLFISVPCCAQKQAAAEEHAARVRLQQLNEVLEGEAVALRVQVQQAAADGELRRHQLTLEIRERGVVIDALKAQVEALKASVGAHSTSMDGYHCGSRFAVCNKRPPSPLPTHVLCACCTVTVLRGPAGCASCHGGSHRGEQGPE